MAKKATEAKTEATVEETATVDPSQNVETDAYVPTYKISPKFKEAVLRALGKHPFNQVAGILQALNVETMDHNTLNQLVNVLGQFPYEEIGGVITNVNQFIEQVIPED